MQHPDEGTIHAWLDGALDEAASADVEAHVDFCKECAAAVADARGLIAGTSRVLSALDAVPGGVLPAARPAAPAAIQPSTPAATTAAPEPNVIPMRPRRSVWTRLRSTPSIAAAAAVLVVAAGTFATLSRSGDRAAPSMSEYMVLDSAASDRVSGPSGPSQPVSIPSNAPAPASAVPQVAPTTSPRPGRPGARAEASANAARRLADVPSSRERQPAADSVSLQKSADLTSVVTTSQAPAPAPPPAAVSRDSTAVVGRAAGALVEQRSMRSGFGAGSGAPLVLIAGCFEVVPADQDAAQTETAQRRSEESLANAALPIRFTLDTTRSVLSPRAAEVSVQERGQRIVRGFWTQSSATARVVWTAREHPPLRIDLATGEPKATREDTGRPVTLRRCP